MESARADSHRELLMFSLPPHLLAKAKKGSILYFWQEQLEQLNKNHADFLSQYAEEHKRETSRYYSGISLTASPGCRSVEGSMSRASSQNMARSNTVPVDTWSSSIFKSPEPKPAAKPKIFQGKQGKRSEENYDWNWNSMLGQLVAYKQKRGDCDVPASYGDNKALAKWVKLQRSKARAGQMSPAEIEMLESLGFRWVPHNKNIQSFDESWNSMLERLKEYQRKYGDCLVPQRYQEDIALGMFLTHCGKRL